MVKVSKGETKPFLTNEELDYLALQYLKLKATNPEIQKLGYTFNQFISEYLEDELALVKEMKR